MEDIYRGLLMTSSNGIIKEYMFKFLGKVYFTTTYSHSAIIF